MAPGSGLASAPAGSPPQPTPRAGRRSPRSKLAATSGAPAAAAAPAMGEEDYYLELCERPVHFEKANPVNCVFFDEANKQVRASPHPPLPRGGARPACRLGAQGRSARPGRVPGDPAWGLFSCPGVGPGPALPCRVGGGTRFHSARGFLSQTDSQVDSKPASWTQRLLASVSTLVFS